MYAGEESLGIKVSVIVPPSIEVFGVDTTWRVERGIINTLDDVCAPLDGLEFTKDLVLDDDGSFCWGRSLSAEDTEGTDVNLFTLVLVLTYDH